MDMKVQTLGSLIDKLYAVREKRRELAEKDKLLAAEVDELQAAILARLEAEGTDKASSKKATVSRSTVTVANVTDWDKFWAFIHKNKFNHMLQRRVSDPAYRELVELAQSDKKLAKQLEGAGVESFIKVNLNLRSL